MIFIPFFILFLSILIALGMAVNKAIMKEEILICSKKCKYFSLRTKYQAKCTKHSRFLGVQVGGKGDACFWKCVQCVKGVI